MGWMCWRMALQEPGGAARTLDRKLAADSFCFSKSAHRKTREVSVLLHCALLRPHLSACSVLGLSLHEGR